MNSIEPFAELIDFVDTEETMRKLELCGRVSRLSTPRDNSADDFVRMLIKRGHESVLEHVSLTFHIVCDRAIMAELTRHRHCAFTVESTRFIKYNELTVIAPLHNGGYRADGCFDDEAHCFNTWHEQIEQAEDTYNLLIERGAKPDQARAILPQCTKSELYMTANLREWRHILKLRTARSVHPQMRIIMNQILNTFRQKLPVIVEDIKS